MEPAAVAPKRLVAAEDIPRFSPLAFLKDRAALVAWAALCVACVAFFLRMMGLKPSSVAFIALFLASGVVAALVVRYCTVRRFWQDAAAVVEAIDKIEQLSCLVDDPTSLEGRIALGMAEALSAKGAAQIGALKEEMRLEHEYSELWTHEVKAPLAASKLALESLHGEAAVILKEQVERIESLVEQALYKSRMSSLAADYLISETSLLACVRQACKANMRTLVARGVALEFDIDENTTVLADASWVTFMVSQLVLNSAKYDATRIRFSARSAEGEGVNGRTVLEVADDGCGIPAQDVPRVFDRGFTGSVGRRHGAATGMGLYLVAFMCARMGLGITLASEEGQGTRVMIAFPHDRRRLFLAAAPDNAGDHADRRPPA